MEVIVGEPKKDKNGFTLSLNFITYFMIFTMTIIYFFPGMISQGLFDGFNLFLLVYSWVLTLGDVLLILAFILICIKTYTTKLDKKNEDASLPEPNKLWNDVLGIIVNIYTVALSFLIGFYYIAGLYVVATIVSLAYFYVRRDFSMKCLKIKLAHIEENSFGV